MFFRLAGIKGKVLAARRSGMKRVVLPKKNEADLRDIPEEALRDLGVNLVERIDELLPLTLEAARDEESHRPLQAGEPVTTGTEFRAEGGSGTPELDRVSSWWFAGYFCLRTQGLRGFSLLCLPWPVRQPLTNRLNPSPDPL